MPNDKQSLGLGFVRHFDLDVPIRELLAYGEFIGQCMDDARATERARCLLIAASYADYDQPGPDTAKEIYDSIEQG